MFKTGDHVARRLLPSTWGMVLQNYGAYVLVGWSDKTAVMPVAALIRKSDRSK